MRLINLEFINQCNADQIRLEVERMDHRRCHYHDHYHDHYHKRLVSSKQLTCATPMHRNR